VVRFITPDELRRRPPRSAEELERYGQLLARQPRRDYLDAIDSERRALTLVLDGDRLLRVPDNARQSRTMDRIRGELREQIRTQMVGRRRFRGPVSVEIDLHAVGVAQPPASPPSVKAYLDLLGKRGEKALVYEDDDLVRHLRVRRHAADHPIHRAQPEDWLYMDDPRFPWGPSAGVQVVIVVRPLRVYVADYDRLFRRRDQIFGDDARNRDWDDDEPAGAQFWTRGWDDPHDSDRLRDLRSEEADDTNDRGLFAPGGLYDYSPEMSVMRDDERRRRRREMKALIDRLILDQRPDDLDRPGPVAEVDRISWASIPELLAMKRHYPVMAGVFYVPLPPNKKGGQDWSKTVRDEMEGHQAKLGIHGRPLDLDSPLSLDISVRGAIAGRKDYDNLAHLLLPPFEEIFCAGRRGTVVSYRVYESEGNEPGVRVMLMTDSRLQALEDAITASREWVLRHGPRLMRER
jgi:hypothetical protein